MQDQQNQEVSRIGILFGDDFSQEEQSQLVSGKIIINRDKANTQFHELENQTDNQLPVNNCLVIKIPVNENNQEKITEYLKNLTEKNTDFDNNPLYSYTVDNQIQELQKVKTLQVGNYIYVSTGPTGSLEEQYNSFFSEFMELGGRQIAETQENIVDASLSSKKSAEEVINDVNNGERFMSSILHSLKFECNISLNNTFGSKLREIVNQYDPEFANSPPFIFLRYFKSLDIDLKFSSVKELPETIRNRILLGKMFENQQQALDLTEFKALPLFESVDQEIEIFFTVEDFMAVKFQGNKFGVSQYLKNFGKDFIGSSLQQPKQEAEQKQED